MKLKFLRTIRKMLPKYALGLFILGLIILSFCNLVFIIAEQDEERINTNSLCLYLLMIAYGISRVWRFHPTFKKDYLIQLALSPWNSSKALPRGPICLHWIDIFIVGFIVFLTRIFPVQNWLIIPFIFLVGYNIGLFLSFCFSEQKGFIISYVFLAPITVYPHMNTYIALTMLIILTVIGTIGLYCYFKEFPWNTSWWKHNQVEELKSQAISRRVIQWPFRELRVLQMFSGGTDVGIFSAILIFWYFHSIGWVIFQLDGVRITGAFYALPISILLLTRFFCYVLKYQPPISFLGRICTGHLIIPGYDVVFLGPLVILITSIFMPSLLKTVNIPAHIAYELSISICVFLASAFPPIYEEWHYTGKHRYISVQSKPIRTQNKVRRS